MRRAGPEGTHRRTRCAPLHGQRSNRPDTEGAHDGAALEAGVAGVRIVDLPAGLLQGWDLADELPEALKAASVGPLF